MCDSETLANGGDPNPDQDLLLSSSLDLDSSDAAATLLHQTTQSLLMASNMMLLPNGGPGGLGIGGLASDGKLPLAAGPPTPATPTHGAVNSHVKVNVEELIRENFALREKLKDVTSDRDRLVCEVANLRLELDMSELKRLPQERYVS